MLDLQQLVDIFEINILIAIKSFYIRTYTNKLFSFVCCSPSLLLFLCVFEETIQKSPFVSNFFTAQQHIYLFFAPMLYGIHILKVTALNLKWTQPGASDLNKCCDFILSVCGQIQWEKLFFGVLVVFQYGSNLLNPLIKQMLRICLYHFLLRYILCHQNSYFFILLSFSVYMLKVQHYTLWSFTVGIE